MSTSSVSPGFYEWTLPVPRDQWDPQDPKLQQAVMPYAHVENILRYTFRNKGFLLQAFTHESYPESSRIVPGYMRPLDFLGDALLKEMLTVQLYGTVDPLTPKALHETRKRLECNRFFGYVVVRNGNAQAASVAFLRAQRAHRSIRHKTGRWGVSRLRD
ncbi:hypothetical protein MRX96_034131 [Rhipicephalus microplus]